ncbi:MAG: ATP-binding protein [Paludibacteraceae bacterium]|nr:ATP-binding protein [Paludibacteraceae bacterium]
MRRLSYIVALICCMLCGGASAIQQLALSRFDNYTQKDGLNYNIVQCAYQDAQGYMWFGTSQGLHRFDGYTFHPYKYGNADGQVRGELIRCIFQDSKKRFWVGTENGGLNVYYPTTESFAAIPLAKNGMARYSANSIVETPDGKIWVGTDEGLAYLDEGLLLEYYHFKDTEIGSIPFIKALKVDKYGRIWIGTGESGVKVFNPSTGELRSILDDSEVRSICITKDDVVWIGTYDKGVYIVNIMDRGKFDLVHQTNLPTTGAEASVKAICEGADGRMWIGTRSGLICYDRISKEYVVNVNDVHNDITLVNNSIIDLYVDKKGDLWVCTRGGISYRNSEKQPFVLIQESKNDNRYLNCGQVYAFLEMPGQKIWVGTESGGVNIYDMKSGRFDYITQTNSGLSVNCIKSLAQVGNEVLVGTYMGGLNVLDAQTGKVKRVYRHSDSDKKSISSDNVWSICVCKNGEVLLGTGDGVDKFNPSNGTFEHMDRLAYNKEVWKVYEDSDKDLWIFTPDEIIIYLVKEERTIAYEERARSIVEKAKNVFYVGSLERGLVEYNKYTGEIGTLNENDGLSNNNVQSIFEWRDYYIVCTTNGISRIHKGDKEIVNYDESDGLQSRQFHYGAVYTCSDGRVLAGGNAGFNIVNLSDLHPNEFVPPVLLEDVKVFNQEVPANQISLNENGESCLSLNYDQNMVTFKYSALSYSRVNKNMFKYRLVSKDKSWLGSNEDEAWINAGHENKCTYTNLHPGDYVFEVKGANCDGVWNENPLRVHLYVKPPFWNTWWCKTLMTMVVVGLILMFLYHYRSRMILRNKLDLEKQKAEEMEKVEQLKLDFFTNISHELRTPLTLILGPLSKILKDKGVSSESKKMAELAERNANKLLRLVNQILDFRKIESGSLQAIYKPGDLPALLETVVRAFQTEGEAKGIQISLDVDDASRGKRMLFDSDKIEKIVDNLVSNSMKFTPRGGAIKVAMEMLPQHKYAAENICDSFQISVADTGKGMSESDQKHVFERFYQSNDEKEAGIGTGIGLNLVYDLVKLMDGEVLLDSALGKGTTFKVVLPFFESGEESTEKAEEPEESNTAVESQDGEAAELPEEEKPVLLIAEDNEELRKFVAIHFESRFNVVEAEDGKIALEKAAEQIPDVVITDLMMPNICGDELCNKLKHDEKTSHIPIILLTAVHSKESEIESLKRGADDYITKPFDIEVLDQKVMNMMRLKDKIRSRFKIEMISEPTKVATQSPDEKFMIKAMKVIEDNLSDADFDIEKFAVEVGVSRMQLYRKMNAITGMTVKEFIRNIRIKRAKQLLEDGAMTVSEVAYNVGFKDIAYFRKCFKQQVGINPSEISKGE